MNQRALTLIEVVAALAIIAIGIVGILALFPTGLKQAGEAGDRTNAALIGELFMGELRLHEHELARGCTTADVLQTAGMSDYPGDADTPFEGFWLTFDATRTLGSDEAWGSAGRVALIADYEPYEVKIEISKVIKGVRSNGSRIYNDAFDTPTGPSTVQATVTVMWPRAATERERDKQNKMTFVQLLRPRQ